jgi:hypothetical protein
VSKVKTYKQVSQVDHQAVINHQAVIFEALLPAKLLLRKIEEEEYGFGLCEAFDDHTYPHRSGDA